METVQNPREGKIACPVLGKMSIQEKNNTINWVAESIESIADKISTGNKSPIPPETTKSKSGEIFGKMTVKMISEIPDCKEKYLLKLRIQQDIINTCFCINWANLTNVLMPLTSTNPSISIYPSIHILFHALNLLRLQYIHD